VHSADGDTTDADIAGSTYPVGYAGMDTTENHSLVQATIMCLEKYASDTDRYRRLLPQVYANGLTVNAQLVRRSVA
jgi:endonuclease YncB( thermonuclease family)